MLRLVWCSLLLLLLLALSAAGFGFLLPSTSAGRRQPARLLALSAQQDPFRPVRSSVDPIAINALNSALFGGSSSVEVALEEAISKRMASDEHSLTAEELSDLQSKVLGVFRDLDDLRVALESAVDSTPFIKKYGMEGDYGLGSDLSSNPLTQMQHAECLLALYMLRSGDTPQFIDEEKLGVLSR
jgi:hypothetical protein